RTQLRPRPSRLAVAPAHGGGELPVRRARRRPGREHRPHQPRAVGRCTPRGHRLGPRGRRRPARRPACRGRPPPPAPRPPPALPAAPDAEAARRTVLEVMQGQGFAPDEEAGAEGETLLRQCPLLEAADRHPEVVCAVHRGLIDGILETVGPEGERGAVDVELTPFTAPGSCTLALRARTA